MTPLYSNALAIFAIANIWTFMLFGLDKLRAESGEWRVPESTLLGFAFFGGLIGAYTGRAVFRHKTRKQPFSKNLHEIALLQVIALGGGAGWMLA